MTRPVAGAGPSPGRVSRRVALRIAAGVALAVFYTLTLAQAATLSRYPYLQNVASDRATVMWATLESGSGSVRYSLDQKTWRTVTARIRAFLPAQTGLVFTFYQYEADLSPLSPATDYYYQVLVDGAGIADGTGTIIQPIRFRTAGPGPFNYLAFGDSGINSTEQRTLAAMMMREPNVSLVVHTGDIAYLHGTFQEFQSNHSDIYGNSSPSLNGNMMRSLPFFLTPGNHEYYTPDWTLFPYLSLHSFPKEGVPAADANYYYSFDWSNAHFVSLDANLKESFEPNEQWKVRAVTPLTSAINGDGYMLKWLEQDLAGSRKFWRIVFFHQSPYAGGNNASDPAGKAFRDYIAPILDRHEVPLAMNGHEHSYQRSKPIRNHLAVAAGEGTVYITTGGGGYALYPLTPPSLVGDVSAYAEKVFHYMRVEVQPYQTTVRAIRIDGKEIDRLTLAPKPRVDAAVNAASFTPALSPGSLFSIFGRYLAADEGQAQSLPLPTQFPGMGVTLNGYPLPLLYVSSTQINAQLPFDMKGAATLRVTTSNGLSEIPVNIADVAPAIFVASTDQGQFPAVLHADGTLVSPSAPAKTGEVVLIFLTGLGQVNGQITCGQAAPASPPLTVTAQVQVEIGSGSRLSPEFAGLAPGFAGLYQVNVQVPPLAGGNHTLRIIAAGSSSNPVTLAVASASQ
ncbi:MAG: metallophosphoesterase [Acidobacteria bacterium]|nr:metallophosphoesterase [Acidobacteriota bacterium]